MNKQIITFSADEQKLVKTGGINCYASNIVSYIEAHFALGQNWSGYDLVRAVWSNDNNMTAISTVLDSDGVCVVPFEVLKTKGTVMVNLVGSISASDVLTDRLTTFPCEAVKVARKAKINGSETTPITPSQFEQFVAVVISEVEKVTGMTAEAETLPAGSSATARYENGVLYLGIPQGIQGIQGEAGADGADGNGIVQVLYNSDYSITFVFTNGEQFTTPSLRGETGATGPRGPAGQDGRDGTDGVTPSLSVGTVTTLPSTEDAYVTRRGTDENPVFDFGIPQGPEGGTGEVSYADLSSLLPTDTASGAIASFPDGQSVIPAVAVKAEIEPIQSGSGTPSPDNVRPISGHTECVTSRCGKNLADATYGTQVPSVSTGQMVTANGWSTSLIPIDTSRNYVMSAVGTSQRYVLFYGNNEEYLGYYTTNSVPSYLLNSSQYFASAKYVRLRSDSSSDANPNLQLELGSTATAYEAFNGTTHTTSLGRTVYGGEAEIVGGVLTDKMGYIASYNGETIGEPWLSDRDEYVAGTTPSIGAEVVYTLATPQTYRLTPTEVALLEGQNNVWTDSGEVEVTYKADVGLYIDKKLG